MMIHHLSRSMQQLILSVSLVLAAQSVFSSTTMPICPSPDMLKHFSADFTETHPIAFDQKTGAMTVSVFQRRDFMAEDQTFPGYGKLVFIVSGLSEYPGVTNDNAVADALNQIQLDSETPYMYRVFKDVVIPVCSYSGPDDLIKAVLYQMPEYKRIPKVTV